MMIINKNEEVMEVEIDFNESFVHETGGPEQDD